MEIVEGKDQPIHLPQEHSELGCAVGLMLRYTKSLYSARKVAVLDFGLCVLKGVVELKNKGVFCCCIDKKKEDSGPNMHHGRKKYRCSSLIKMLVTSNNITGMRNFVKFSSICTTLHEGTRLHYVSHVLDL